jgi:2,3-bisphosphoglycerate-dependent phosphoglycerate mutase
MDATAVVPQPTVQFDVEGTTEVLLIRHGRSADVVPGSDDSLDPPLHDDGVLQAAALAGRLAGKKLDAVYASHLRRAVDTAMALATPRRLPVEVHNDLEEVKLGEWGAGEFRRRAATQDPEFVAWSRTGRWDGIPGCEGDAVFRHRVTAVVETLAARHAGGCIAVVAHGGVVNAYLAEVLGIERSVWLSVENTSVTVVRVGSGGHLVLVANDCNHLYDPVLGP